MCPRVSRLCEICNKSFSSANIARHKRHMHCYCLDCSQLVSRKRHHCFKTAGTGANIAAYPPNDEDQFLLVHVPVLIRKSLYRKLELDGSAWPLFNVDQDLGEKVKKILKEGCLTCDLSEYLDITDDHHSCKNPTREEFVAALNQCSENITEDSINNVYRAAFGRSPDGFVL